MPVTMKQVVDALLPEEPDYQAAAASLGPEVLPLLRQLVEGDNLELATKAASLAGHFEGGQAIAVLHVAAASALPSVRVAAAAAARNLPSEQASRVLTALVADSDAGVRKVAMSAVPPDASDELRAALMKAAPHTADVQAASALAEPAGGEYAEPQYPMVDPLEVPGLTADEAAMGLGTLAKPGEQPSPEQPSYPTIGAAEAPPGVNAPPAAPGY